MYTVGSHYSAVEIYMVFALHTEKKATLWSDYESTIDTPWLGLTGEPWGAFPEFFGEQIRQENASTLHNDSLRELVYNMNKYLTGARGLKFEGCHMQTLAPVLDERYRKLSFWQPMVPPVTTKPGSMTTPRALNVGEL